MYPAGEAHSNSSLASLVSDPLQMLTGLKDPRQSTLLMLPTMVDVLPTG